MHTHNLLRASDTIPQDTPYGDKYLFFVTFENQGMSIVKEFDLSECCLALVQISLHYLKFSTLKMMIVYSQK